MLTLILTLLVFGQVEDTYLVTNPDGSAEIRQWSANDFYIQLDSIPAPTMNYTVKCDTLFLESTTIIYNGEPVYFVQLQPLGFF